MYHPSLIASSVMFSSICFNNPKQKSPKHRILFGQGDHQFNLESNSSWISKIYKLIKYKIEQPKPVAMHLQLCMCNLQCNWKWKYKGALFNDQVWKEQNWVTKWYHQIKIKSEFLSFICFNEFSILFLHFHPRYRPALPSYHGC